MTTTATAPVAPLNAQAATILQRSVCFVLRCGVLGNNRKVDLDALAKVLGSEPEAAQPGRALDEQQFHATMRLIDPKELRGVLGVQGRAKSYLRSVGIPSHRVFGEGTTLVPSVRAREAWDRLVEFEAELRGENRALRGRYLAAMAEQSVKLGPLFDPALYKSPEEVERAHTIEWSIVSFASPDNLETIDKALARESHRRYEQQLAQAFDEVVALLRGEALEIVTDLERKLAPGDDGKPRVLRGTALRDVQAFLANLPSRNMTGDADLPRALDRVRRLASGLDVQQLRDSAALRDGLRAAAAEAKAALASLVATGRGRAIGLGAMPDVG